MDRVGQVWDVGYNEIALVVRSDKRTFTWVHMLVYIGRDPVDFIQYPALEELFADEKYSCRRIV